MKILFASILAVLLGFSAQLWVRASVPDLELQATAAWNAGRLKEAEHLSRRILAREPSSERACAILDQVAQHSAQPELQIAVAEARIRAGDSRSQQLADAGDIAMSHSLLRLAESYYARELDLNPDNPALHHRMATISGLRLDPDGMQRNLLKWCESGDPDSEIVMLYLSSSSIDGRDAAGAEDTLRRCLTSDSADNKTRYALARCLIANGRHQGCDAILNHAADDPIQATLSAMSKAVAGNSETAALQLPATPPEGIAADYHFVNGLIAYQQERWADSVEGFRRATALQPLSRTFRSRYCEALRRAGETKLEERAVKQLEAVFEIVSIAKSSTPPDEPTLQRLADLCESVGAPQAALIVSQCQPR